MPAPASSSDFTARGAFFCLLLAAQFGMQPIVTKLFVAPGAHKPTLVLTCELIKAVLAAVFMFMERGAAAMDGWRLGDSLRLAAVPALIYAAQNVAIQVSYQNVDGVTFNTLQQSKIIWGALFVYLVLGRVQSARKCIALALLAVASAVLTLPKAMAGRGAGADAAGADDSGTWLMWGILPCLFACICSGLASALCQYATMGTPRSAFMFSCELSFFCAIVLVTGMAARGERPDFSGWNAGTCYAILQNSVGGIFVGQVVKYAGSVRKSFSVVLGIAVTAVGEFAIFGTALRQEALLAITIVLFAVYLHTYRPPPPKIAAEGDKDQKKNADLKKTE